MPGESFEELIAKLGRQFHTTRLSGGITLEATFVGDLLEAAGYYEQGSSRAMKPIPITAARRIAKDFGYDQVVIMARRIDNALPPLNGETANNTGRAEGEHITTYGVTKTHCDVAALMGSTLKRIARWPSEQDRIDLEDLLDELQSGTFGYEDYDNVGRRIGALRRLLGK